jgi:hypothetical protein
LTFDPDGQAVAPSGQIGHRCVLVQGAIFAFTPRFDPSSQIGVIADKLKI